MHFSLSLSIMPRILSRTIPTSSHRPSTKMSSNASCSNHCIVTRIPLRRNISDLTCDLQDDVPYVSSCVYETNSFCSRRMTNCSTNQSFQHQGKSCYPQVSCCSDAAKLGKHYGDACTRTTASTVPRSTVGCSLSSCDLEESSSEYLYCYQSYEYGNDVQDEKDFAEPPLSLTDANPFIQVGAPDSYTNRNYNPAITFAASPPSSLSEFHRMAMFKKQPSRVEFNSSDTFAKMIDEKEEELTCTRKRSPISLLTASLMPRLEDSSWGYFVDVVEED